MTNKYVLIKNKLTGEIHFELANSKNPHSDNYEIYPAHSQEAIDLIGQSLGSKATLETQPGGFMAMPEVITYRNFFAGMALCGQLACSEGSGAYSDVARISYGMADAMMEARK